MGHQKALTSYAHGLSGHAVRRILLLAVASLLAPLGAAVEPAAEPPHDRLLLFSFARDTPPLPCENEQACDRAPAALVVRYRPLDATPGCGTIGVSGLPEDEGWGRTGPACLAFGDGATVSLVGTDVFLEGYAVGGAAPGDPVCEPVRSAAAVYVFQGIVWGPNGVWSGVFAGPGYDRACPGA